MLFTSSISHNYKNIIKYFERSLFMNKQYNYMPYNQGYVKPNDDRFIGGGFVFPFLLGGVTGAAIAPNFYRPQYNRPIYPQPYYPYPPYGYYR